MFKNADGALRVREDLLNISFLLVRSLGDASKSNHAEAELKQYRELIDKLLDLIQEDGLSKISASQSALAARVPRPPN